MGYAFFLDDCDFSLLNIGQVTEETQPDPGGDDDTPTVTYAVSAETNPILMAICYEQGWAENEDYMTFEEAAAVTSIGEVFKSSSIGSFNEFQYFTGVTSIANNAFYECRSLTNITLPSSIVSIGSLAFRFCNNLVAINFPAATVSIAENAIQQSGIQVITFNSNATISTSGNIQYDAPVTTIYLGTGVTDYTLYDGCVYTSDFSTLIMCPVRASSISVHHSVTSIGNKACRNCTLLTSLSLPSSVTSVGQHAFSGCTSLASVSIPSVTTIGSSGFAGCTKLANISMPSIVSIDGLTFRYSIPTSLDIPSTCTAIGNAFQNVTTLTSMTCRATTPPNIAAQSLSGWCSGEGKHIYVPSASVDTYKAANVWSSYADYISAISE